MSATFVTNGVVRGSFIINWTDQSIVSVHDVTDEQNLRVKVPTSGIGNTYDIADAYSVFNVEKVTLGGGNPTAVNTVPATIDAAVPSVGTFLTIALSSSATLVGIPGDVSDQVAHIYGQVTREIFMDDEFLTDGPDGWQHLPFNSWSSAVDHAETENLPNLVIKTDSTVDRQLKNFVIRGINGPTSSTSTATTWTSRK